MGNMIDVLTDQMDNIASSAVESAPFDKSTSGRILAVLDGNNYTVKMSDGTEKSVLSLTSDSFAINDVVVVSALQNDAKNSYILGKPGVAKISASGDSNMTKEVYDANNNGIVDNAEKVNGHTVLTDVPSGAVFTDTTYTDATTSVHGLMSSTDKTKLNGIAAGAEVNVNADFNATSGDAQILNLPSTFPPSTHTHTKSDITDFPTIPDQLSDLSDDISHRLVTDVEKSTWNGKQSALSGDITGHYHSTDRNRANHTGTQTSSTISDFSSAALSAAPAETVTSIGSLVYGATAKTSPIDTDAVPIMDSADSNKIKKFSWAYVKSVLNTYFSSIFAAISHNHTTSQITDMPTSLPANGGNAATVNNHTVNKDVPSDALFTDTTYADATASVHGLMSSIDKTKLDGIAAGAEVNVNANWNATSGDAQILNLPSTFPPSAHSHVKSDITDFPTIPDQLSDLADDSTHRVVTDAEKSSWDGKQSALSGDVPGHYHSTDRNRANHTGTQTASTISDFSSAALSAAPAETVTSIGTLVNGATAKSTPVDADMLPIMDSADSNKIKKLSWAHVKSVLNTYFGSIFAGISHTHTLGSISDVSASATEVNYTKGVTSAIQIQLNSKASTAVATQSSNGLLSANDKTKLDGVSTGANNYSLPIANANTLGGVKSGTDITVDSSGNVSVTDNSHNHTISNVTGLQTALDAKLATSLLGTNSGVAQLGSDGKVPSSQLPSYVDDVLEYSGYANFPSTGETGKIYVDTTTNRTYRWGGSTYVEISSSLALGETSSTAYAGDKGKAVTDALASHKNNISNPHSVTASQVGLGAFETTATNIKMNGTQGVGVLSTVARADHIHPVDTSRAAASHTHTVSSITDLTATAAELNVLDGITSTVTELNYTDGVTSNIQTQLNSKANSSSLATVATSGSYSDLTNKPAIPTITNTMISRANDNSAPAGSTQIDANLLDGYDSGYFANIKLSSTQPTGQRVNDFWLQIV